MPSHEGGLSLLHGPRGHTDEISSQEADLGSIGKNFLTSRTMEQLIFGEPSLMESEPDLKSEDEGLDQRSKNKLCVCVCVSLCLFLSV